MTMKVSAPNGAVVNFPDGTSPEVIRKAMEEVSQRYVAPVKTVKTGNDAANDIAKSTGRGVLEGVTALGGLPGDISSGLQWAGNTAFDAARNVIAGPRSPEAQKAVEQLRSPLPAIPTSNTILGAVDKATGGNLTYEPQTTAGKYAKTVGMFAPASLAFGGIPGVVSGTTAALGSEAAGQFTEGSGAEPYARLAGALLGGIAPAVARRAVTPFPTSPQRNAAANYLQGEGVDLTAGQRTGSMPLRYFESEVGGHRTATMMDRQGEQFTAAALRRAGINANRATPDVINNGFTRIGAAFDRLAAGNTLRPDRAFATDLGDALNWYAGRVAPPNRAPIIADYANEIANSARGGTISGEAYQSLRSRIAADARSAGDQYIGHTLRELTNTLDDAMERSIRASNPAELGAWQEARNQYRNLLVLEKAATGAGENAAAGIISPSALRNATVNQSRRAYARGQGDFAELARSGEATMKPLPQSGTAPRLAARSVLGLPALAGAALGGQLGGWESTLAGALLGSGASSLAGRAVLSGPGRAILGNQVFANQGPHTVQELAAALANTTASNRLALPSN